MPPARRHARRQPFLERWARLSYRHRWKIIAAWVFALFAIVAANYFVGGTFVSEFSVPGTEAQKARDLLEANFPARAGDDADIVFHAPAGINTPETQARIEDVLSHVSSIPSVASVESPLDNPHFISSDGTIARAKVHWKARATDVSSADIDQFLRFVDSANSPNLAVEAGGRVVSQHERPAFGSEWIGLVAAVLILLIAFGSVIAMGLPLGAAIFGLGIGFSLIGLAANFAHFPAFSPQFAAMIGLGVGIDYSLLIITRFREGLHHGRNVEESVVLAVTTSGRAVIFAGAVVAVAFLGLFLMGLPFVAALGTSGAIVVIVSVLVAVTLMPAAMSLVGHRIDAWKVPFLHTTEGVDESSTWYRWSAMIQRKPLPYFCMAAAVLLLCAAPALKMRLGFTDSGNNPTSSHSRRAYDLLTTGFGPGFNGPLVLAVDMSDGGRDSLDNIRTALQDVPGVADVSAPVVNPAGDTALITVVPTTKPQDGATKDLVHRLRQQDVPAAAEGTGAKIYLGGGLAGFIDAQDRISERMPWMFAGVIGLSFVLLTIVFRSVVVAAKAAVMNLLSIGASYGVLVAVFQWGWLSAPVGIEKGPIETFLPMMMFAILFGLSMDYEVFLISRIREEYLRTGNNATAVSHGLAATARVITAAAAIMVTVFLTFVLGDERVIKEFGLGLATAIFVDATIVRLILVPSTMELLGDRNWWLPSWLDRLLPHISVDAEPEPARVPVAGPAGGGGS